MKIEHSVASQLYDLNRQATGPGELPMTDGPSFADAVEKVLNDMRTTVNAGEQAAAQAMAGQGDVQSMVEALTSTEMALETAVAVRDKVVEAYQEILRMPV